MGSSFIEVMSGCFTAIFSSNFFNLSSNFCSFLSVAASSFFISNFTFRISIFFRIAALFLNLFSVSPYSLAKMTSFTGPKSP